jgi:IS30 family transposase
VLRHKGKRQQPPDRREHFASGTPIHHRPKEIDTRTTFGHWEADTMVSSHGKNRACVATFIERKTRWYTEIVMPDRSAASMNHAIATVQQQLPPGAMQSLTVDRGMEFATHVSITRAFGIPRYFAAWQRGSNENANGLLREFFPKKTNVATISDAQLAATMHAINHRPRKCLHWNSAQDAFTHSLSHST